MSDLLSIIFFIAIAAVLFYLYIKSPDNIKERIDMIFSAIFKTSNSGGYSAGREESESEEYVPQRLGGSGWLNAGPSFSNPSGAHSSVDSMRRKDPKGTYRVAMKVNGKIVGTG